MLNSSIQKVIVLTLDEDRERRAHINQHFKDIGIDDFSFFKAISSSNSLVAEFYRKGLVKGYPECFRCSSKDCECPNNILIPQQVANCLSFVAIWKSIAGKNGLFLICEDDVVFHKNSIPLLNNVLSSLNNFTDEKIVIRLVASGQEPNKTLDLDRPLKITSEPAMSNAAYILSGSMASYLLEKFDAISHTSDVWLHDHIASHAGVKAITVEPLIGTDLSFNKEHAKFLSRIHPKGIDEDDIKREQNHNQRVGSVSEYQDMLRIWNVI